MAAALDCQASLQISKSPPAVSPSPASMSVSAGSTPISSPAGKPAAFPTTNSACARLAQLAPQARHRACHLQAHRALPSPIGRVPGGRQRGDRGRAPWRSCRNWCRGGDTASTSLAHLEQGLGPRPRCISCACREQPLSPESRPWMTTCWQRYRPIPGCAATPRLCLDPRPQSGQTAVCHARTPLPRSGAIRNSQHSANASANKAGNPRWPRRRPPPHEPPLATLRAPSELPASASPHSGIHRNHA